MLFKTLTLENIRSYEEETIALDPGSNLIFGKNGAGKSTLLQGVFGGLFQTAIGNKGLISNDFTLDKLVRKGEDEGRIELVFEIGDAEYTIEWILRVREDETGERTAQTKSGYPVLESDALETPVAGVRDVRAVMTNDILGMDAESYVNSVYVQQGDITRLIHADTDTRREILDGLLGLHHLDELIQRMDHVRLEYSKAKRDAKTLLRESHNRLNEMADEDAVREQLSTLSEELDETTDAIENLDEKIRTAEKKRDRAQESLDSISELESKLEDVQRKLEDAQADLRKHKSTLADEKKAKNDATESLSTAREKLSDALDTDRLNAVDGDLTDKNTAETALTEARSDAEEARSNLNELKNGKKQEIETELRYLRSQMETLIDELDTARTNKESATDAVQQATEKKKDAKRRVKQLQNELVGKREEITKTAAELDLPGDAPIDTLAATHVPEKRQSIVREKEEVNAAIGRLETLEEQITTLTAEKECPVCGATEEAHDLDAEAVAEDHATKLVSLRTRLSELSEAQEELNSLESHVKAARELRNHTLKEARTAVTDADEAIEDAEQSIHDAGERIEEKQARHEGLEAKIEEKESALDDVSERIEAAEKDRETEEAIVERLNDVVSIHSTIAELEREIADHERNIEHGHEMRRQVQRRVNDLETDHDELNATLDELNVEELREKLRMAKKYINTKKNERNDRKEEADALRTDLAEARATLQDIQAETEKLEGLEAQRNWADELEKEAESVQAAYKDVRSNLRERNLTLLNKYTNEMFDNLYQNQSYRGVHIDEEYEITLLAADGDRIEPELSSGGEGTILNLALRTGVYKIIAQREGVTGAALPPLILDEPTTYLDDDHVDELQSMIDTINEWNVPQVLVVSHDKHLVENAATAFHVRKDKKTKTSTVERDISGPSSGEGNNVIETDEPTPEREPPAGIGTEGGVND